MLLIKVFYGIYSEKMYENRVTISIKKRFLRKFIFHQNFLFEKKEKISMKQFCSNVSEPVWGKLITLSGEEYLVTSGKIFN